MVKRMLGFLYKESSTLHQAAYLLGFFAILSQVLAFMRDRLLAHIFGASSALDIYYAAFRIPDFIFVTVASVVSISVLVPFIVEKEEDSKESVREFVESVFTFFSLLMFAACGIAYIAMPEIIPRLFKGFTLEELNQTIFVSRVLLLSPVALGFSNLFGSITQAYNRFGVYAVAPLLYNTGIIVGILTFADKYGPVGVAMGIVIGAFLHALIQIPFVWSVGLFPRLKPNFNWKSIRNVATLSVPRTLTLSTSHISLLFLTSLASLMAPGSISILSFSINIQSVPLSIIGVSYSLAAFPTLTRYFAEKNIFGFIRQMATTARHIIFWSLPLTALFIVLRAQIIRVLLGTGRFDWNDTRLTAAALALFAISSVFQSLLLLFMRAFYSAGRTKKPFYISIFSMAMIIGSSYFFVYLFNNYSGFSSFIATIMKVENTQSAAVLMLPLGYSIGTIFSGIANWIGFELEFGRRVEWASSFSKEVLITVGQSFAASVIIAVVSYFGLSFFDPFFSNDSLSGIFLQGLFAGVIGIICGFGVLKLLGSHELDEAMSALRKKFWRTRVIATDPEIV